MKGDELKILEKQIHIYSVPTDAFYNEVEWKLHKRINKNRLFVTNLKKIVEKTEDKDKMAKIQKHIISTNKRMFKIKNNLRAEFVKNKGSIRNLRNESLNKRNIISVFESTLTRTLQIKEDALSEDIIVVQTYFFDVLEDIIKNGFMHNGEKYICFTASAGQIRTKKTVFIKEKIWNKHKNTLMCGLTIEKINELGGVNINKFLAYLALTNSATDEWKDFDINRAIVVDDFETNVRCEVDYIDDKTFEVERKLVDIPIEHTDGCGMILPRKSKKSMMVRLPFVKGLLVPFDFKKFILEKKCSSTVKDIYGDEHDIIKDNIQYIFTKSQFKMWKYYKNWEDYKQKYIENKCQAGKCNEEPDQFKNARLNYQMLQTLTDITDDELKTVANETDNNIKNIAKDIKTMLKVLGVTEQNTSKNYLQQAISLYPELLNDTYCKEVLKQVKKSMVKDAWAGKLEIDGKYTFICPDLYAFCEYLFLNDKNPNGLLKNGEVFCSLYKHKNKLDCLRSPHLYREHAVRRNVIDKEKERWFITKGLYTSCHDPISKILQFDNDGDNSLVCADKTIVDVAERNMKGIVPLYYKMGVANKEIVTNDSIYEGLKAAYTGGNIGMISNEITKVWCSDNINLDAIKINCAMTNFVIDYAKTLYKPEIPKEKRKLLSEYSKQKLPHFFIYAKNKKKKNVSETNDCVVNRLKNKGIIKNYRINFKTQYGEDFDYRMLMSGENVNVDLNKTIIDKYTELDLNKRFLDTTPNDKDFTGDNLYVYRDIREQLLGINNDKKYVVDVLIEYLYKYKNSSYKTTLWSSFGDIIVENLKRNLSKKYGEDTIQCEQCRKRMMKKSNRHKYCDECLEEKERERQIDKWHRNKRKYRNATALA